MRKVLLSSLLAASVSVAMIGQAFAQFADVSSGYWAQQFIQYLSGRNVISGYPDNTFRPNQPVTRAEFAAMLAKSQNLQTGPVSQTQFVDVPGGHWASGAIQSVAQRGWITGYPGGRFMPNQPISMAEMYTIVSKVSGQPTLSETEATDVLNAFQDAQQVPQWARIPVATAAQGGMHVSEVTPNRLDPNTQATRASVATTMAKLLNEQFRNPAGVEIGESVNVTGTLRATARQGEWEVVTQDGRHYVIQNLGELAQQPWFRVGNQVQLQGRINPEATTAQRTVVNVQNLASAQIQENRVAVTGTLRPSPTTRGGWVVVTQDNKVYRIMNPEEYTNRSWFGYGATVSVTGNVRPDIALPQSEGTALVASEVSPAQQQQQVVISGLLRPTVEAGGWTVTDTATNQKYVLLDIEQDRNEPWFQSGTRVEVTGEVRTDIPTIYQEGPVLRVSEISPHPSAITGIQAVRLYYPNPVNIVRNPLTMLGEPIVRNLEGPNLPEKAVQALIQGPTSVETLRGYYLDQDIRQLTVDSVDVTNGIANVVLKAPTADFKFQNDVVVPTRLNEQMTRTLTQFSGVRDVTTSIVGPNNQLIWSSKQTQ